MEYRDSRLSQRQTPSFTVQREAVYSRRHPIIPRLCVPEWKKDMANRKLITQNADLGCIPNFEHNDAMYVEKSEQLYYNVEDRDRVESRYKVPPRNELMNLPMHHPASRYRSSMVYRKPALDDDACVNDDDLRRD